MGGHISRARQYLLAGVSYAIPFVACGGILIAAAIALVPMTATGPDFDFSTGGTESAPVRN